MGGTYCCSEQQALRIATDVSGLLWVRVAFERGCVRVDIHVHIYDIFERVCARADIYMVECTSGLIYIIFIFECVSG